MELGAEGRAWGLAERSGSPATRWGAAGQGAAPGPAKPPPSFSNLLCTPLHRNLCRRHLQAYPASPASLWGGGQAPGASYVSPRHMQTVRRQHPAEGRQSGWRGPGAGPSGRMNPGLPGARGRAGQATHPTNARITVRLIISGLAKIQTWSLRKAQIKHDFSQAVNQGEGYPVMTELEIIWGWGRAPTGLLHSSHPRSPRTWSWKAGGTLSPGRLVPGTGAGVGASETQVG